MTWKIWFRDKMRLALLLLIAAFVVARAQSLGGAGAAFTPFTLQAVNGGGAIPYHYIATGATNQDAQCPSATAAQIYGWNPSNTGAVPVFVKIYNMSSGPTSSSTVVKTITIPGNTAGAGNNKDSIMGVALPTGFCFGVTSNLADNDATAVSSGVASIDFDFKN